MRRIKGLAIGIALGLAIMYVGTEDDVLDKQRIYCAKVEQGLWPDYLKTYEKECRYGR